MGRGGRARWLRAGAGAMAACAVQNLELLGESGQPAGVVRSGELVVVRATLRLEMRSRNPLSE